MTFVKSALKRLLYYSGYYHVRRRLLGRRKTPLIIVMYHHLVDDEVQRTDWATRQHVSRSQFRSHIQYLRSRYRMLTVEEATAELESGGDFAAPTAAITFDDGYESVYQLAFPILKEFGISATVYLPVDWINGKMVPWWLRLYNIVNNLELGDPNLRLFSRIAGAVRTDSRSVDRLSEDRLRIRLQYDTEASLREQPPDETEAIIQRLTEAFPQRGKKTAPQMAPLNWEQIKLMRSSGFRFGAHTCSHPNLKHISLEMAEREISESKREIETRTDETVLGFAYPYGMDQDIYKQLEPILRKEGFRYACTAAPGINTGTANRFLLSRISLPLSTSPAIIGRSVLLELIQA
jgi:peptidoglycan/xylan/chitin deacetylase (PgdA/CDA1 family)